MDKRRLHQRGKRILIYLLVAAFLSIAVFFGIYKLFLGQAFADRGVSENTTPILYTPSQKPDLEYYAAKFTCDAQEKLDDLPSFSVGIFPFTIPNTQNSCNRAADFIGVEGFLDAFLYGETGIGKPARATSKVTVFSEHHPGLYGLRKLHSEGKSLDRSIVFYWWMFPLPMACPNRGFSYTLFWGDFVKLEDAARARGLDFVALFMEGVELLLELNGWNPLNPPKKPSLDDQNSYLQLNHVFVKAWMSVRCMRIYVPDEASLEDSEKQLVSFMKAHLIRYPAEYSCGVK